MATSNSQGFLIGQESKKNNKKTDQSVVGTNVNIMKDKKEDLRKGIWGLATGQLENSKVKRGKQKGDTGSFGDDREDWGYKVTTGHTFYNPAIEGPGKVEPDKWDTVTEDVMGDKTYIDRQATERKVPIPDINDMMNFDLGKAGDDLDYAQWSKNLKPEQKGRWDQFVSAIKDPQVMEQIGQFDFNTGTDATPMSNDSRNRYNSMVDPNNPSYNPELTKWAQEQKINMEDGLQDPEMQQMLGYQRFQKMKGLTSEALKGTEIDVNKVFSPYGVNSHQLGKTRYHEPERYARVTSKSNASEITVKGEPIDVTTTKKEKVGSRKYQVNRRSGEKVEINEFGQPIRR